MADATNSLLKVYKTLATLYQKSASGCLVLSTSQGQQWQLYLYKGRIAYAFGEQQHRARRLQRALKQQGVSLAVWANETFRCPWEYHFLLKASHTSRLTVSQTQNIIYAILREVLFHIADANQVSAKWQAGWAIVSLANPEVTVPPSQIKPLFTEVKTLQQQWQASGLPHDHVDDAPQLLLPTKPTAAPTASQLNLEALFNGQRTFWDLMLLMKQSVESLSRMFCYYQKQGLVKLRTLPDHDAPQEQSALATQQDWLSRPLVVCIDDSVQMCGQIELMLQRLGYRCLCISDPVQALPQLMQQESAPVLVLIDLVMPVMNGYELCSHLRRVAAFAETPVALMTGSKSIVDYVRAKMVGANDLLLKPLEPKHLQALLTKRAGSSPVPSTAGIPSSALGTLNLSLV
ncbi:MAG: response regulator [Spirulina sp. SIO3F2]|nr:response regulator [Spirulina sp. SIO3F2]